MLDSNRYHKKDGEKVMGILTNIRRFYTRTFVKTAPSYTITFAATPAGKTWTTEGKLISTPGSPAKSGYRFSGGTEQVRVRLQAERRAREVALREAARKELERKIREAALRETARREAAKRAFDKAVTSAKARKSIVEETRARTILGLVQESTRKEREKIIQRGKEVFGKSVAQAKKGFVEEMVKARKVPRVLEKGVKKIVLSLPEFIPSLLELEKEFGKTKGGKVFDFLGGGTLTERELGRQRSDLNTDIASFNKKFGGRELSQTEFNKAKAINSLIKRREEKLKASEKEFSKSVKRKIGRVVFDPVWGRVGSKIQYPTGMTSAFKTLENFNVKKYDRLVEGAQKKYNHSPTKINLRKLNAYKDNQNRARENLQSLKSDINPYASPSVLDVALITLEGYSLIKGSKIAKVKFVGKQTTKGNKIITDLAFVTDKGKTIGIARGITVTRGKAGATFTLGKAGVRAIGLPSGKSKILRKRVFAGIERVVSKPEKFVLRSKLKILKKIPMEIPKIKLPGAKTITVVKRNIRGFKQAGFGREISAKGDKLFKEITRVKGIKTNDFASISGILTKQDLSLIIGKTITTTGDKARFIGIIKGSRGVGSLTGIQKSQYQLALKKVISVVSVAAAKAGKVKGLTSAQKIAATHIIIKRTIKPVIVKKVAVLKPRLKPIVRPSVAPLRLKQIPKARTKRKQKVAQLSAQGQSIKQRIAQVTKARQKAKTKLAQRSLQKTRQRLKMRLKILTIQKQKVAAIKLRPGFMPTPAQAKILGLVIPKVKKVKKKILKPKKKKARSFHVYARPLRKKGRKKPKLIRVTKKPIKKRRARDLRNYLVDTSLSRTAKLKPSSRKPSKRILKSPTGYAFKTKKKFRKYKIVKGKRVPLRKWRVIEKKKHLLDTKQEKRQITLRKRVAQLQKQARKPVTKSKSPTRSPVRKSVTPTQSNYNQILSKSVKRKRKASPAQLKALRRGRKILEERRRR